MSKEVVIPILPCRNLKETLEFYVALGFRVTYEQHAPYVYGGVEYENIQIHFHGSKNLEPDKESSYVVLIIVQDVDVLHDMFTAGIKNTFGNQLRRGVPRLGSINSLSKDRRFNLLDPSGNHLIVVQQTKVEKVKPKAGETTPLAKTLKQARIFAYSKDDPKLAARVLDKALKKTEPEPDAVRFRVYVLRADIANELGDNETLERYIFAARNIQLTEADKLELAEELERVREL
jgi:catechol 2,3-dioxygenase-like lactoylglutathione lyase family enzyme